MTHPQKQCPPYCKMCSRCEKVTHYKVVCRSTQKQRQSQRSPQRNMTTHKVQQEKEPYKRQQRNSGRNFYVVNIRYLNPDSIRSIIFTKLESNTSQIRTQITSKIDTRSDGNLMPFRLFKITFPKSTVPELCTTQITHLH